MKIPASNGEFGYAHCRVPFAPVVQVPLQQAVSVTHWDPSSSHVPGCGGVPKQRLPLQSPLSQ